MGSRCRTRCPRSGLGCRTRLLQSREFWVPGRPVSSARDDRSGLPDGVGALPSPSGGGRTVRRRRRAAGGRGPRGGVEACRSAATDTQTIRTDRPRLAKPRPKWSHPCSSVDRVTAERSRGVCARLMRLPSLRVGVSGGPPSGNPLLALRSIGCLRTGAERPGPSIGRGSGGCRRSGRERASGRSASPAKLGGLFIHRGRAHEGRAAIGRRGPDHHGCVSAPPKPHDTVCRVTVTVAVPKTVTVTVRWIPVRGIDGRVIMGSVKRERISVSEIDARSSPKNGCGSDSPSSRTASSTMANRGDGSGSRKQQNNSGESRIPSYPR